MATLCGSPLYMAPEIIKNKQYTVKSDIWSFGIIIYEMLYGFIPYRSNNIYNLIKTIEKNELNFYNKSNISSNCKSLIRSMLKKDPKLELHGKNYFNINGLKMTYFLKEKNELLEIWIDSINLPKLEYSNNSFKYKSISNNIIDDSLEFNFNLNSSYNKLEDSIYYSLTDSETEIDSETDNESDSEDKDHFNRNICMLFDKKISKQIKTN